LNYTLDSIKINSKWFDELDRKQNVYQKITYKGLNLYFQLYKFRLHGQENEHTFMTSISMLRKETKYTSTEIFDLLKKLKAAKVIKVENVSRWEYLLDDKGELKDKDILHITAVNPFPIGKFEREKGEDRFYIYVPLDLFQKYEDVGLNEKYYALYCLIEKWTHNMEEKAFMSIVRMSKILGFDKDYLNQMIYELNRHYFLASHSRPNGKGGYKFEHYILNSAKEEDVKKFVEGYGHIIEPLIKRVDKKRKDKKKSINIEEEVESLEGARNLVLPSNNIKSSFGESKENWGKFKDNVDEITPEEIDSLCDELYELL